MDDREEDRADSEDSMIGTLVFDRYKLLKRLGAGSFGRIYSAEYENQYYAIKLENKNHGQNLLENEAYIMSYLNGPGLPAVKSYGYSSRHNILVMELMGKSLEDIFESFVVRKMTVRCVCNIGYQMMEIMEYIHKKHIIHRDIKPDNFVVGRGEKKKYIYILDFGLAKKYRSSRTLKHNPMVKNKNLIGTARYASINALDGKSQSRRDDLEAIGYVLMYFLRGRLPWQGIPVKNKEERYRKIMEKKIETSAEELCQGFPEEFMNYIHYTRNLEYEQDPDYGFLKGLFINVLKKGGFIVDCYYDWDKTTIKYFRDFEHFKKKEKKENNTITPKNNTNDISNVNIGQPEQNNNNNNINNLNIKSIQTLENIDYGYRLNTDLSYANNKINSNAINKTPNDYIQSNTKLNQYNINRNNNNNNKNNNVASNISMNKNANISAFNPTNYEGSAIGPKMNETAQYQSNVDNYIKPNNENNNINNTINNTNLDIPKNNYLNNNNESKALRQNNSNIDNNLGSSIPKKNPRLEKDNCCCVIF